MLSFETQYLWVMLKLWVKMAKAKIAQNLEKNRTDVKTVSLFGQALSAKVSWNHLPVLTTKKIHMPSVITELIWFLNGDNNIRFLLEHKVDIWTANAYDHNSKKSDFPPMSIDEYRKRVLEDKDFAEEFGSLGGVYGYIWRNFHGVDQIERALQNLKEKPETRQNIVTAWDPVEIPNVALPPCHFNFQLHVKEGVLSLTMNQRSADWFLGVPFNITSYALLLLLFAKYSGYEPGHLYIHFGDAHLYENHFKQALTQILRWPFKKKPPKIQISDEVLGTNLLGLKKKYFVLTDYRYMGRIKAKMAV